MENLLGGLLLIAVATVHICATHYRWGWYINSWQVLVGRKRMGETGFSTYSYLMCFLVLLFGCKKLFEGIAGFF